MFKYADFCLRVAEWNFEGKNGNNFVICLNYKHFFDIFWENGMQLNEGFYIEKNPKTLIHEFTFKIIYNFPPQWMPFEYFGEIP